MVALLIPVFCIVLIALAYAVLLGKRLNQTFLLAISSIIALLYFSGLMNFQGSLLVGYVLVVVLALFSAILLVVKFLKDPKSFNKVSIVPGLIMFCIFLVISLYLNYGRMFLIWDEFSYWGIVVKHMYFFDALSTFEGSYLVIQNYFPGIPIFNYFWSRPFESFTEYPSYIGMNMIFFSIIMALIKKINARSVLFVGVFLLLPLLMGSGFYSSLYVDGILGILMGANLLFYYKYGYEKSLYGVLGVASITFLMTLTKEIGVVFSGIAFLIIFADMIFLRRRQILAFYRKKKHRIKKILIVVLILLPLVSCLIAYSSWKWHVNLVGTNSESVGSGIDIVKLINNDLDECQKETANTFKTAVFKGNGYPIYPLSNSFALQLILLYTFFSCISVFVFYHSKDKKRELLLFLGITLGSAIYLFVLYLSYLFVFECWEAIKLASYHRYVFSYLMVMLTSLLFFFVVEPRPLPRSLVRKLLIWILFVTFCIWLISNSTESIRVEILDARKTANSTIGSRSYYASISKWFEYIQQTGEKVYILVQGSQGVQKLILIHTICPADIEWIPDYSVNLEPYYPEGYDPWTMIISPQDWGEYILDNYTLVYIFEYDEQFFNNYGYFFEEVVRDQLYRVTVDNEGALHLVKLPLLE